MDNLLVFTLISALSFSATEVVKSIINIYKPEWKFGMMISVFFSFAFVLGLGYGILSWLGSVDYSTTMIPALTRSTDIVTSSLVLSLGSKGLNAFLETLGINLSGGLKKKGN